MHTNSQMHPILDYFDHHPLVQLFTTIVILLGVIALLGLIMSGTVPTFHDYPNPNIHPFGS